MSHRKVVVPSSLKNLKPYEALDNIPLSRLARTGTAVVRRLINTAQGIAIRIQGQDSMVTISQRQYEDMVGLIDQLREEQSAESFNEVLSQQFDLLMESMEKAETAKLSQDALFGDPGDLNSTYRPGTTESGSLK